MQEFSLTFRRESDLAATLQELSFFGSLAAPREAWARLVHALQDGQNGDVLAAADGIAMAAVPEEAFPHPQRADVGVNAAGAAVFQTPGGVLVSIWAIESGDLGLLVDFGRESRFAATMLLAGIASREPSAYQPLALAAAELAEYNES